MHGILERPLSAVSTWLGDTALSHLLQDVDWLVPAIQTVHILAVALVISSVVLSFLAVVGLHGREQPLARSIGRFTPGIRIGLPVLLATGLLMIAAEPDRALPNPMFQIKMGLLVFAVALSSAYGRRLRQTAAVPGASAGVGVRVAAVASLACWLAVLVAGRWIAYTLSH